MLTLDGLQTYLGTATLNAPILLNRLPDTPDRCVVVNIHGGAAMQIEGAFQPALVDIRCRDITDTGAEALALAVDAFLLETLSPTLIGGYPVQSIQPTAGPPAYLDRDVDNRTVYQCAYHICVAR